MSETFVMGKDWLQAAVTALGGEEATALLQGFPYSGFGVLRADGELAIPAEFGPPDFEHSWDLRLFRDNREIHAWRVGPVEWAWRLAVAGEWRHAIVRHQILWGTSMAPAGDWQLLTETRGTKVWLPPHVKLAGPEIALRIIERVEPERGTGIAGIVDAMIAEIEPAAPLMETGACRHAE